MSAASFISMAGLISNMGYGGGLFLMGWTGGYVLLAMLLAPYLRKFGKFTVPQFIGDRFYSKSASTVAVACLLTASLTYIIGQMTGVGVAFSRFLGVSSETGIYVGMGIVFVYAVFGGMKGITYTQVAQYIVLISAYIIPAIFISIQLTGNPIPQLGLGSNIVGQDISLLQRLDKVVTDLGFANYTTTDAGGMLNMFVYTMSLMIGTAGLPHVIMRFFTVPTVAAARSSAGWALIFIALLYTTAPAVAAMAKTNLMRTITPGVVMKERRSLRGRLANRRRGSSGLDEALGEDRSAEVGRQERRRSHPVLQRQVQERRVQGQGRSCWLEGQRADGQRRHHRARQSGNRAAAELGHRAGCCRWSGCRSVDCCRPADGHFGRCLARPDQERLRARYQREKRAAGGQDLDGSGDRHRRLSGSQPAGIRGRYRGPGLRYCGEFAVPGDHDGDLLEEDEQGRRHGRHACRPVHHPVLRLRSTRVSSSSREPSTWT
jgi:hypothetical protein